MDLKVEVTVEEVLGLYLKMEAVTPPTFIASIRFHT